MVGFQDFCSASSLLLRSMSGGRCLRRVLRYVGTRARFQPWMASRSCGEVESVRYGGAEAQRTSVGAAATCEKTNRVQAQTMTETLCEC